jgi:hypothetical protein
VTERYRVEFALRDGEPDWQVYTWTATREHAATECEEAEDRGNYRARVLDMWDDERVVM